ncbi:helix-turn-helix transcriptional regulator [Paracoccus aminophilus]|uniref:helix-turn-helix transcriptional regulator n=1 Tax=Paracoccus aminophilus TaxID=34003 RepID=UPI00041E1943|nr:helix-turn-helix transcriptional regulator [Paracoccus aminophilus]
MSSSNLKSVSRLTAPLPVRPLAARRSDDALARLILASDQPDFDRHLTQTLQELISFDLAMISLYQDKELVEVSSAALPERIESEVLHSYAGHTYQHSPFFQMHRRKMSSGFYLMEKMARNPALSRPSTAAEMLEIDQQEEVGYLTAGWPKRLKEMDIAIRVSERHTVQVALYRTGNRGFSASDLSAVEPIQSSLMAICQRHWHSRTRHLQASQDPILAALHRLGGGSLSARELEVMRQLISGVAEKEIAAALEVSAETVKTHRKRAYQKLDVASRVELLVKLLDQKAGAETVSLRRLT